MRFSAFYRTALLLVGLVISGISLSHAADWPRQLPTAAARTRWNISHCALCPPASRSPVLCSLLMRPSLPAVPRHRITVLVTLRAFTPVERRRQRTQTEPPVYWRAERRSRCSTNAGSDSGQRHRGDSALALYDQLSTIAPTLIINYDDKAGSHC